MNTNPFLSNPDLKMEHLWSQRDHLQSVWEYHVWMMEHAAEPGMRNSHRAVADHIFEALVQLDHLMVALERGTVSKRAFVTKNGNTTTDK